MVNRRRLLKIYSLKFCDIWKNFYFYRILDNENFKMEVEQMTFVTHLMKVKFLRLYSIVHVATETTKMSNFTCQEKSFISIFFTCQVSACQLQPFSRHDLANDVYSQTVKTVFSHLKRDSQHEIFF